MIHRLTPEEIADMAAALVGDRLCVASALPEDMIDHVFMPLGLMGFPSDIEPEDVGNVVEFLSKALPTGINGYPVFLSMRIVHKEDWAQVIERFTKAQEALRT